MEKLCESTPVSHTSVAGVITHKHIHTRRRTCPASINYPVCPADLADAVLTIVLCAG